jgi:hypothetical protein
LTHQLKVFPCLNLWLAHVPGAVFNQIWLCNPHTLLSPVVLLTTIARSPR